MPVALSPMLPSEKGFRSLHVDGEMNEIVTCDKRDSDLEKCKTDSKCLTKNRSRVVYDGGSK